MATTAKREAFLAKLEYIIDEEGNKHHIYPMKIKHLELVTELFSKINDEYIVLNMPSPLTDEQGKPVLNDDGEVIIDTTAYDAQSELLEIALNDDYENILEWLDIRMIQDILDSYRGLSMLKKKIAMESKVLPGEP
jgi:hypothetical protein